MSNQLFACANYATALPFISPDNGANWSLVNSVPSNLAWNDATGSLTGLFLAMCGSSNDIYISIDRAINWTAITASTTRFWRDIDMSGDGTKIIIISGGGTGISGIFKLTYSGSSWSSLVDITKPGITSFWASCSISGDGNVIYAAASNNDICKSIDGGTNWTTLSSYSSLPSKSWFSLATDNTGTNVGACDIGGYLYISIDGGASFIHQTTPGIGNWQNIEITGNGNKIIACEGTGFVWIGNLISGVWNWTQQTSIGSKNWLRVACSSDFTILGAAVNGGNIFISTNGGISWVEQTALPANVGWHGLLVSASPVCVIGTTKILMADGSIKMIKNIQRGELVLTNKDTNESKRVCRVVSSSYSGDIIILQKELIGNTDKLILTSGHPIWINNDSNRVCCRDIIGKEVKNMCDYFYNIQYEDEGTYYAENIKVDSLSANNHERKLPKELYFNENNYDEKCIIVEEDDPRRNKPPMIKQYKHLD